MDRTSALRGLLNLSTSLQTALANVAEFEWDSGADLVMFDASHIACLLGRFLAGELSSAEVEAWANAIECREDIGFSGVLTREALHEFANPTSTYALTQLRAQWWLSRLRWSGT